jgi:hypothetical protein
MRGKEVEVVGWALPLLIATRFKMSHFVNVIFFFSPSNLPLKRDCFLNNF